MLSPDIKRIRVSVIIPVLNMVATLGRTLNSILAQGYEPIEIIVIDGGSTDGTLELLQSYDDSIAHLIVGEDDGIASAFNIGLQKAGGDLIAILNADDVWKQGALRAVVETVAEHPGGIYYGSVEYRDVEAGVAYVRTPRLADMKCRMSLFHPSMMIHRLVYERVGGYNESLAYAMDSEWCHRAMAANERFVRVDAVLAEMKLGGVSDRQFRGALAEYRDSLVSNKLASRTRAYVCFFFYLSMKALMQRKILKWIKYKLRGYL